MSYLRKRLDIPWNSDGGHSRKMAEVIGRRDIGHLTVDITETAAIVDAANALSAFDALNTNDDARAIARAIVRMVHALRLKGGRRRRRTTSQH